MLALARARGRNSVAGVRSIDQLLCVCRKSRTCDGVHLVRESERVRVSERVRETLNPDP